MFGFCLLCKNVVTGVGEEDCFMKKYQSHRKKPESQKVLE